MEYQQEALKSILPPTIRNSVDKHYNSVLQEIRLRIGMPVELVTKERIITLPICTTEEFIRFCVNTSSKYSPWSSDTFGRGYITAPGGHRLGLCGTYVSNGMSATFKDITSICIRISRDFPGLASEALKMEGSILIIGVPGSGKTTLLRDLIRQKSNNGISISVVDERQEIFPVYNGNFCYAVGNRTDVISNCSKSQGIEMTLRSMSPETIAVDEITATEDALALLQAGWCGVSLIATAHASSRKDLFNRPVYKPIIQAGLFDNLIIMRRNKSWTAERITQ